MKLHDYQIYAKNFILSHPYCALWMTMGTGKTSVTLCALQELNPTNHVLIVAPINIARTTWLNEIQKWGFPFRTKSFVANENDKRLTKKQRYELYEDLKNASPTIYFINRDLIHELVEWSLSQNPAIWYFPIVVLDEAQSFKSYNSRRFNVMKAIRPAISRLIELTGTPAPKGIEDLWSQVYLLDMGQRLGPNISAFRDAFLIPIDYIDNAPTKYIPKYGAEEEIYRRISDLAISIKNTNLQLPECIFNKIDIDLDQKEFALYKKMLAEHVIDLNNTKVTAVNAGVLFFKLSQMASGAIYTDPQRREYAVIHTKKLEMTKYIIEQTDSPILIAYHFRSDLDMLKKYFVKSKIPFTAFDGKSKTIQDWNDGKIPILLIQPASAGHGLNLQTGPGHTMIWYTLPSSLEEYLQCNARLYRQGQQKNVMIHILSMKKTVDEKMWKKLLKKEKDQQNLIDSVDVTDNIQELLQTIHEALEEV